MAGLGFKDFTVGEVLTSSDVDGYLMQQTVMRFADSGARGSALGTAPGTAVALAEGMVTYLNDTNVLSVYDGTTWRDVGYTYRDTIYYTSSDTFTKATYPWLRAVRVRLVGGGGGGQDIGTYSAGAGGGGGGYAEGFLAADSLGTAVTVTVGAGGSSGSGTGGASSFGTAVAANGGSGSSGGSGTAGDFLMDGENSGGSSLNRLNANGGSTMFSPGLPVRPNAGGDGQGSQTGRLYGGGASGSTSGDSARTGAAGAAGIVIVDLFS